MAVRKRGLGRGLDALLTAEPTPQAGSTELPLDQIEPNSRQPRSDFDPAELSALARSIAAQGLIQPILVSEEKAGRFTIVAGERRWRAAREAGLSKVPVVVRSIEGEGARLETALVENIQRADLNALEEAEAFDRLHKKFGMSHKQVAERIGKSRASVTNRLRLLGLPAEIQKMIRAGELTEGQARPLLSLGSKPDQLRLARRAVKEGLSARQLEALTRSPEAAPKQKKSAKKLDPDTRAAQDRLTKKLQTKVEIKRRGGKGAVWLHFHSEEELMRLYEMLMKTGRQK